MTEYPGVIERVKAAVIDAFIIVMLLFVFYKLYSFVGEVPDFIRGVTVVLIFAFYDPLMTSILGATIGHGAVGIQVRRADDYSKNIPFHLAFIRFLVKIALGWISLLTVLASDDRKAIHDMIVGSVVLYQPVKSE